MNYKLDKLLKEKESLTDKSAIYYMNKRIELLKSIIAKRDDLQLRINELSDSDFEELKRLNRKLEPVERD